MPAMMRQERIFGSDVQLFRPERFLECSEDKKTEMTRTVDLVFGYGRWMCAGKTLALVELHKIFFEVCRTKSRTAEEMHRKCDDSREN